VGSRRARGRRRRRGTALARGPAKLARLKLDSHAQLTDRAAAERVRINMSWLLKLRRAAVLGQTVTILVADQWLGIDLELIPLLGLVALGLIANVGLQLWFFLVAEYESDAIWLERGRSLLGSILLFDLLLLIGLLYSTGGVTNPFSVFFFVNIVLATVILSGVWLRVIYITAVVGYLLLLVDSRPLSIDGVPLLHGGGGFGASFTDWLAGGDLTLYAKGSAVAFIAVALFTAYFVRRLNQALGERDEQLVQERQRRSDNERLESLATLAAGAAHELASPLSTIAVVARELERDLELHSSHDGTPASASASSTGTPSMGTASTNASSNGASSNSSDGAAEPSSFAHAVDDARLIRDEVARCRRILDQMSLDAGAQVGEEMARVTARELVDGAIDKLVGRERVVVEEIGGAGERALLVPRTALRRSVRALVKNGLEASPADAVVDVRIEPSGGAGAAFVVRDRGTGMDAETLGRAGDPFFTTKDPGRGMGLGLFLVRSLAERLDGNFVLESAPGAGVLARLDLPRCGVPRESGARVGPRSGRSEPGDRDDAPVPGDRAD